MRMRLARAIVSVCFLCVLGCSSGPRLNDVSGKVTLDDGSPLSKGEIIFTSAKFTGRAVLGSDGSFQAKLPDGSFKIIFLGTTIQEYGSKEPPKELIPKKYTDLKTTDLSQEVKGSAKDVHVSIPQEKSA